jgi:transcriptional regulator with XRE-family HTH domain
MTPATVRAKRTALNLSVRSVARAANISHAALSRYENGSLRLSAEVLDQIGELLGIDRLRRAKRDLRRHAMGTARAIDALYSQVEA